MQSGVTSKIMIIDDNSENLKLLGNMLNSQGYEVFAFHRGENGYKAAQKSKPDLILLDINMPDKNGYEVCKDFKEDKNLHDIPIIFLSALSSLEDKVMAFKNGGVDYITKPFQFEEVEVRVKTHLKILEMQRLLENEKEHLELVVAERTKELIEAYKKIRTFDKVKSDYIKSVSNEMNGLWKGIFKVLENIFPNDKTKDMEHLYNSKDRIDSMLTDAVLLNKIEFFEEKPKMEEVLVMDIMKTVNKIEERVDFNLYRELNLEKIVILCNKELFVKGIDIVLEFAHSYCRNMKIEMKSNEDHKFIYLNFVLQDFFLKNDDIFDFIDYKYNDGKSKNERPIAISNILAHRIMRLFDGDLYLEKTKENIALLTVKIPKVEVH